jgi:hypothetical protein
MPRPSRNPVYLYDDVMVAIIPERHLNNGQPSLHSALIASAPQKWVSTPSISVQGSVITRRYCTDSSVAGAG